MSNPLNTETIQIKFTTNDFANLGIYTLSIPHIWIA